MGKTSIAGEITGGVCAPTVGAEQLIPHLPRGPLPGEIERPRGPVPGAEMLIRVPKIPHVALSPDSRGRLFGEDIIAVLGDGKDGKLIQCMHHSGRNVTPMNLYLYDPKTGKGICLDCKNSTEMSKGFLPGLESKIEELERK